MNQRMKPIDVISEGPVRDLFLALNHYISTGDHVGEGVAMEDHQGDYLFNIAYDPQNAVDAADYIRFRRRITEIMEAGAIPLMVTEPDGRRGQFLVALLHVKPADVRRLAQELVRSPGAAGWGSMKPLIDEHFPDVRGKILSGEGV